MCGRYVRRGDKQKLAEHFRAKPNPPELPLPDADYNVAPTTHQPIIRQSREKGERELVLARWGLVPFFTKDLKDIKGLSTINAVPRRSPRFQPGVNRSRNGAVLCQCQVFMNGCDLKVVPMIVRRGHATGPAVPSAVP